MPLLEIRNLTKIFPLGESVFSGGSKSEVRAVDDVSFDIEAGETLGLVGEWGSGKSTLGRLVLRLIGPTSGSIKLNGRDLLTTSRNEMRLLRRDMQIIFQDPFGSLDPRMRVEDVIAEPLVIHEKLNKKTRRGRISELLRAVGLVNLPCRAIPTNSAAGSGSASAERLRGPVRDRPGRRVHRGDTVSRRRAVDRGAGPGELAAEHHQRPGDDERMHASADVRIPREQRAGGGIPGRGVVARAVPLLTVAKSPPTYTVEPETAIANAWAAPSILGLKPVSPPVARSTAARWSWMAPNTFVNMPPMYRRDPTSASAWTSPFGVGSQPATTAPVPASATRWCCVAPPPVIVNDPPP